MRNKKASTIFVIILFILMLTTASYARNISVVLNGKKLNLKSSPISRSGLVFVPLRGIFQKMGASVDFYKAEGKIVAKRGKTGIVLTLGSDRAKVNGFGQKMLQPPFVLKGTTYVPLRFLSESMGAKVGWHPPTATVFISTKKGKTKNETQDFLQQQINSYLKSAANSKPKEDKAFKKINPNMKKVKKIDPIKKSPSPSKDDEDDDDVEKIEIEDIKMEEGD